MKAIERLFQYFEIKNIKPTRFEAEIGLANGYLSKQRKKKGDLGESVILKIIDNCIDLNPAWLMFNEAPMLKSEEPALSPMKPEVDSHEVAELKKQVQILTETNSRLSETNSRLSETNSRLTESYIELSNRVMPHAHPLHIAPDANATDTFTEHNAGGGFLESQPKAAAPVAKRLRKK